MVRTQGVDTRVDTKGNPPPPIFERQMKIWYPWASVLDIFPHMGQPSELYTVQWGNLFLKVFPREEERKDPGQWSRTWSAKILQISNNYLGFLYDKHTKSRI
jgi:hypothetical protein